MRKTLKFLLVLMFLVATPLHSNMVNAQNQPEDAATKSINDFAQEATPLDSKETENLLEKVLKGIEKDKDPFLKTKSVVTKDTIIDYKGYNYNEYKLLTINLGIDDTNYHTFGVMVDGQKIISSNEIIITKIDEQTANVQSYTNGELEVDESYSYNEDKEPTINLFAAKAAKAKHDSWWDAFSYCMANESPIPAWIREGISIACAPLCAWGGVTACTACILAASGSYSFSAGWCIGYATRNS